MNLPGDPLGFGQTPGAGACSPPMKTGSSLRSRLLVATLLLAANALLAWTSAALEGGEADETKRWALGAAIAWGLIGQGSDASVSSSSLSAPNPPEALRPPASGAETLLAPFAGGSLELMAPRVLEDLGRPRVFAHVDLGAALGFSYDVAKEGTPASMSQQVTLTPETSVPGQGSVTEAQVEPLMLSAGAGLAFSLDAGSWRVRIKPSFEYVRQEIEVKGTVHRAFSLEPSSLATTDFRLVRLAGRETRTYHGIGPGLEVEVDAARMHPFMLSVFLSGRAYALLGDLDVDFGDAEDDAYGSASASWRFRPENWLYRATMGIRLRWLPERGG